MKIRGASRVIRPPVRIRRRRKVILRNPKENLIKYARVDPQKFNEINHKSRAFYDSQPGRLLNKFVSRKIQVQWEVSVAVARNQGTT